MSNSFLDEIEFESDAEREELKRWFDIIGEEKYKQYAKTIRENTSIEKVSFKHLKECAVYDHDLNVAMYSIFRFVEYNFIRICTDNGTIEKIKKLSQKKCGTDDNSCILFSLLVNEVKTLNPRNGYEELKHFRNSVMHHKYILSDKRTKQNVKNLLSFIFDDNLRNKKIKQVNNLVTDYENKKYKIYIEECNI